jgi:hypothetical protein
MTMNFDKFGLAALGALAAATPAMGQSTAASPLGLSFTTGVDYSSGDYGATDKTNILVVPLNARLSSGDLRVSATLPYLRIKGPGSVIGGGEGGPIVVDPGSDLPVTKRSGLGDLSLSATYGVLRQDNAGFDLDLTGRVKLPTASKAKGLGTGKADYGVSAEVARTFGNATPFLSVGYRMPGDPEGINLRNSMTASAGASFAAGSTVLIASYDYAGRTSANAFDSHSLFGAVSGAATERLNLTGYGTAGLSKGAADYGLGLLMTLKAL